MIIGEDIKLENLKHINKLHKNSSLLNFTIQTAKKAGDIQLSHFGKISSFDTKSTNIDLVTNADIETEIFIINEINSSFPEHSILSEEAGEINKKNKYQWIIDPLDGTTNFAHNLPIFAVSIALQINGITEIGVVYNPAVDKCFYAENNKGAYLNNNLIYPSKCSKLSESLIATGFPYNHDDRYDKSFEIFKLFYDKTRGIRRLGAASLDLCFVAMGRFEGFYEFGLHSWDICAGSLLVKEAGGVISDWNGDKCPENGKRILASNGLIHKNMLKVLSRDEYNIFY